MNDDTNMNIIIVPVPRPPRVLEAEDLPPLRYMLEIYGHEVKPGSRRVCAAMFETSTPFMNISVGDILNPYFWEDTCSDTLTSLRVTKVEHIIWKHPGAEPAHKVCVWTEKAPK